MLSSSDPATGSFSASIRDDRGHADYGAVHTLLLAEPLDLSAPGTYDLQFHHKYQLDQSFVLRVQGSTDGGASWTTLACYGSCTTWVGQSTGGHFVQEVLSLQDLAPSAAVLLRFQFDWSAAWYFNGAWSLDDVQVFRMENRPPTLEREPGSIAFDPLPAGGASPASTVTMRNTGSSPLVLNSFTLLGKNPGDFELLDVPPQGTDILPCGSRAISVRFTPIGIGPRTATLEIFSSDPAASVQNVLLSGTGTFSLSPAAGTVRTKLTLTGAGFGGAEGRVRIGSTPCEIRSWTPAEIRCVLMTTLDPGPYDVSVRKAATGSPWVTLEDAFAVEPPSVTGLEPESGPPRTLLTIHGTFLSTLSDGARVSLSRSSGGSLLKYPCAIRSWSMDNATGDTTITVAVPGKITPGTYDLRVSNRGLVVERPGAFVVP